MLPAAQRFSTRRGNPSYVVGTRSQDGAQSVAGYVFLSTDVVDVPAYSGKPVVTLVGMDPSGQLTGVKVLRHSEPILLIGIPETALTRFVHQYLGKLAWDKTEIGKGSGTDDGIDAISGATVTVIAENQTIMRSAYQVAREVGIFKPPPRPQAMLSAAEAPAGWKALLSQGAIERLTVEASDLGLPDAREPYIDLYFGYLNAPGIGRAMLGNEGYRRLMEELKPGEHVLFLAANGTGSFKGSAFVRGGIFDRFQVKQDYESFTFRDTDYRNLYSIAAQGAPVFRESGLFILRNAGFSAAYPWRLVFLANRMDKATGAKTFVNFDREYWLPAAYLEGGRPAVERPEAAWIEVWKREALPIAAFAAVLGAAALLYAMRDRLVRRSTHRNARWLSVPRMLVWIVAVGFLGFTLKAQPSVTQVLTWFHSALFHWQWELFLSDPFIGLFWFFIIVAVLLVGRGLFCGWLCPYGALSELAFRIPRLLGLGRYQFHLPQKLHDRLKWVKYAVFVLLLGVSFYSMTTAEQLAEIEPFKTTFLVGVWHRSWPYVLFWSVLFVWSMFSERPFCKYLCPLGAALAIPSTFRNFPLARKAECASCHACQKNCGSLAIDEEGRIDQRECLLCLDCQVLYYDVHACPPLGQERKRRLKKGLPLTPVTAAGYYAPLDGAPEQPRHAPVAGPRIAEAGHPLRWLWEEAKFHLLPWSGGSRGALKAAGIALAVMVSLAWVLSGTGRLAPVAVITWWSGWSLYEVLSRLSYMPWIKEGRWWARGFRRATPADVLAYVATKNMLIGAVLFLSLHSVVRLVPGLQQLAWLH